MTPDAFRYARPGSLDEAVALLGDAGALARVLAGGQSLIPLLAQRLLRPELVVDINRIPGLDQIELLPDCVRMGALVRQEQARLSPLVRMHVPGLSQALDWVASPGIRERGTVIGNLIANAPAAELPAVALALGARFVVRDGTGGHVLAAAELLGSGKRLGPDALATHVLWPRTPGLGGFYEVARRDGHAPVVGAMVRVAAKHCCVGLCGVAAVGMACPTVAHGLFARWPQIPATAELDRLLEQDLSEPLFGTAFVDAAYRREVAPVVIQRAAAAAAGADVGVGVGADTHAGAGAGASRA